MSPLEKLKDSTTSTRREKALLEEPASKIRVTSRLGQDYRVNCETHLALWCRDSEITVDLYNIDNI